MIAPCHISQLPGSLRSSTVGTLIFDKVNFKQIQSLNALLVHGMLMKTLIY